MTVLVFLVWHGCGTLWAAARPPQMPKVGEICFNGGHVSIRPARLGHRTALGPEDRKLAFVTFTATLAANVATPAVAGVALLAYHLGPRLANAGGRPNSAVRRATVAAETPAEQSAFR